MPSSFPLQCWLCFAERERCDFCNVIVWTHTHPVKWETSESFMITEWLFGRLLTALPSTEPGQGNHSTDPRHSFARSHTQKWSWPNPVKPSSIMTGWLTCPNWPGTILMLTLKMKSPLVLGKLRCLVTKWSKSSKNKTNVMFWWLQYLMQLLFCCTSQ